MSGSAVGDGFFVVAYTLILEPSTAILKFHQSVVPPTSLLAAYQEAKLLILTPDGAEPTSEARTVTTPSSILASPTLSVPPPNLLVPWPWPPPSLKRK